MPVALWYAGTGKKSLTPPPVALSADSFQTTSLEIVFPEAVSSVPPQPKTKGLDAGKSTCAFPSSTPSPEPLSPDAQQTVTPKAAAVCNDWSNEVIACAVQLLSGPPQLIEITDGLFVVSWIAMVMASKKPLSVLCAK